MAKGQIANLIDDSIQRVGTEARNQLIDKGEVFIRSRAREVARQIELFLKFHPSLDIQALQSNEEFAALAVQDVGSNGIPAFMRPGLESCYSIRMPPWSTGTCVSLQTSSRPFGPYSHRRYRAKRWLAIMIGKRRMGNSAKNTWP